MDINKCIIWYAFCMEVGCRKSEKNLPIDKAANGIMVEAAAKRHADETGHSVLVGYLIEKEEG